jgi:hypothetical protein
MGTTGTIGHIEWELGMSETSRVTTFRGIREDADGGWQEIAVDVLDGGEDAGDQRYVAVLASEEGERIVEGRTAPTVGDALADVGAQEEEQEGR